MTRYGMESNPAEATIHVQNSPKNWLPRFASQHFRTLGLTNLPLSMVCPTAPSLPYSLRELGNTFHPSKDRDAGANIEMPNLTKMRLFESVCFIMKVAALGALLVNLE